MLYDILENYATHPVGGRMVFPRHGKQARPGACMSPLPCFLAPIWMVANATEHLQTEVVGGKNVFLGQQLLGDVGISSEWKRQFSCMK